MKTLIDLNKKWWYRFLKIIYFVSFLSLLGYFFAVQTETYLPYELLVPDKSSIECVGGNHNKYFVDQLESISRSEALNRSLSPDTISDLCELPLALPVQIDKDLPKNQQDEQFVQNKLNTQLWESQMRNSVKYNLVYETVTLWFELIVVLLITTLGLVLGYEVLRRGFYYVVLGSLRPPKN